MTVTKVRISQSVQHRTSASNANNIATVIKIRQNLAVMVQLIVVRPAKLMGASVSISVSARITVMEVVLVSNVFSL